MRRCGFDSVLRHVYFSYVVITAFVPGSAFVLIRRAFKIEKKDNSGNTKARLCNVLRTLPFFCKMLNSFKFNNTFCQLLRLFLSV
jgi:hypothetical protein